MKRIEGVIGAAPFEGFVFSDDLTVARGFIEAHVRGAINLGDSARNPNVADGNFRALHDPYLAPVSEQSMGMCHDARKDGSLLLLAMKDMLPVWLDERSRSENLQQTQYALGVLAHEMGHARDYGLGLPGMPDKEAGTVAHGKIPYLVAKKAREEYVAVRAECAAQESLLGGVPRQGGEGAILQRAIVTLSGLRDLPPEQVAGWEEAVGRFGYALGQLSALANAASPLLSGDGKIALRTTSDLVWSHFPKEALEEAMVSDAQEVFTAFDGLDAGASDEPGHQLIALCSELLDGAIAFGDTVSGRL